MVDNKLFESGPVSLTKKQISKPLAIDLNTLKILDALGKQLTLQAWKCTIQEKQ